MHWKANGGRVNILTSDPHALAAVHTFLTFQIAEHKAGDPTPCRRDDGLRRWGLGTSPQKRPQSKKSATGK